MTVLQVHNFYRSDRPSGENIVVRRELDLLRDGGIATDTWYQHSDDLLKAGFLGKVKAALDLGGSDGIEAQWRHELSLRPASVLHAHNIWPSFTFRLFSAARSRGLPTVLTLHNHRLIATNTHLLGIHGARRPRDEAERGYFSRLVALHPDRVVSFLYTRALDRCWREGRPQRDVDAYICFTRFHRQQFITAGIPEERIVVKPNFLHHQGPVGAGPGAYALFVGRLSAEKGVDLLASAWAGSRIPLVVAGSGPLQAGLVAAGADVRGFLPMDRILELMAGARFLVMNSTCFEGFPLVLAEALASGTPCLVPDLGGLPEIIADGRLGRLFVPGDARDLLVQAQRLWDEAPAMRAACRAEYETRYTPAVNRRTLVRIYDNVRQHRRPDDGLVTGETP